MAKYDRKCSGCDTVFEVNCKISEKTTIDHPCPNCASVDGDWIMSAPSLVQHQRLTTAKKDTGFKEVLQKIAERNPRTSVTKQV